VSQATPATAAAAASVALDIGPGRGALVIYPSERFRGREIEIVRVDGGELRTHTGVHERSTHGGSMLTAIFGSLAAGEYVVGDGEATVRIEEGEVTELRL
jgi:hypothetical protein